MNHPLSRRSALKILGYGGVGSMISPRFFNSITGTKDERMLERIIPSSGEKLPAVGLGTWIQFDVGAAASERQPLTEVLKGMNNKGGKVIDSSPMYGQAEEVIGDLTASSDKAAQYFYATKVWTSGEENGISQMKESMRKMRRNTIDLMQVHNLVDWQTHLKTLRKWKDEEKIRYTGVTHYTIPMHVELEKIAKSKVVDFVQFNYSIRVRNAEKSLLKAAQDNGVAVIINQPFETGMIFNFVRGKTLPAWVAEYDINSWAQFFLKYILSNPAVTCVIPGTSDPLHVVDNMQAGYGKLPDEKGRKKMVELIASY